MNNTDNAIIEKLTALVGDLLTAAQEHPTQSRKYTRCRAKVEQALRMIGSGYRRELKRPQSIGAPQHELRIEDEPTPVEQSGDLLADNLPEADEKPKPKRGGKKADK